MIQVRKHTGKGRNSSLGSFRDEFVRFVEIHGFLKDVFRVDGPIPRCRYSDAQSSIAFRYGAAFRIGVVAVFLVPSQPDGVEKLHDLSCRSTQDPRRRQANAHPRKIILSFPLGWKSRLDEHRVSFPLFISFVLHLWGSGKSGEKNSHGISTSKGTRNSHMTSSLVLHLRSKAPVTRGTDAVATETNDFHVPLRLTSSMFLMHASAAKRENY